MIAGCSPNGSIRGASGIVRDGDDLLIVGDRSSRTVYRYRLQQADYPAGTEPLLAQIEMSELLLQPMRDGFAPDAESIDLLDSGEVVILSEQLGALVTNEGVLKNYSPVLNTIAGRGLEGLAIYNNSQLAALWEGGFFRSIFLPSTILGAGDLSAGPMKPLLCLHSLDQQSSAPACADGEGIVVLQVPDTPLATQIFRAPDLVWQVDGSELIVLLSSTNQQDNEFKFLWLQKFTLDGEAVGDPINLCDRGYLPEGYRAGRQSNFEGLAWFEPGESLLSINDNSEGATAMIFDVNPWPVTDSSIACDQPL